MDIFDSNGTKLEYSAVLANLPITESCEHVEELMKADYIVLSWRDSEKYTLPVGAYITHKGVNYALLEPYEPEQKSDDEFEYTPNFQHPKMYLGKVPFRFPTTDTEGNSITLLEWPYSGDIDTLLTFFCRTMENVLGLTANTFNYSILGEIDMVVSTTFNTEDILSALTNVANKLKCEWHIDWDYKILYFGHIELSRDEVDETVLEVGVNVGTPSVRSSKEGFYNTYEPQGSTRNISKRAASGEYVQGDVRLALNETDYPDKVIYTNESGTVIASLPQGVKKYVKPLIFDNIFPKLDLYVYDVRCRERDLLDDNGEKIIDHYDGSTPVYKRYAVWYMRLAYATKVAGHVTQWHDYTINPETDIISGKNLGGAFQPNTYEGAESFPLAGRGQADDGGYGFELIYHSTGETIPASGDDTGVVIKAGDYEIVFQQQNDYILPTTASQGIIPKGVKVGGQEVTDLNSLTNLDDGQKGNIVDLYNIVIDNRYNESAQNDLAQETLKYIANQFKDNNSYTLKSDVVAFKKRIDQDELLHTDSSLYIGEKVIYKNGDYELETRVMKLTTKLDYAFEQEIVVGNEVLKGTQTTLKEQVQTILSGGTGSGGGIDSGAVRKIVQAYTNPRFLSKIEDDTAQGFIKMLKGLQIGSQDVEEAILGEGGLFQMGADGKVHLITDSLYVRMRAYFDSVVIREYKHESGNRIVSPAQGFNASRVEYIKVVNNEETIVENPSEADYFRCYWRVDDGEKKAENQFIIGDLAFCEHSDVVNGSLVTKRYWRVVTGRNAGNTTTADGEAWIDLSNAKDGSGNPVMTTITYEGQGGTTQTKSVLSFESGSGYPEAHDDICMLGCTTDTTRQGAIIEYVSGVDAPTYQIYQGLGADATNPYILANKNQITIGYNTATGKADMKVYGDAYIGARDRSTYIEYKQGDGTAQNPPQLNIKARVQMTSAGSTIDGTPINQYQFYDDTTILGLIDGLQDQIDGQIDSWFYNYSPVHVDAQGAPDSTVPLNVEPYSDWDTDDKKIAHLGDTFTNNTTGYCWRFSRNSETNAFEWVIIEDSAVITALQNAARAQETADGKRTIYSVWGAWVKNNVNTLEVGDLFIPTANTTQGGVTYKANKVYKCTTDGSATFQAADYIDDAQAQAKVDAFVSNTYNPDKINLQSQIDGKAETFRQATDPSLDWYVEEGGEVTLDVRANHVGDLWMDISADGGKKTYIYEDNGESADPRYEWKAQDVPDEVFDEIDGKSTIFGNAIATPPTNYKKDDMWLLPAAATINGTAYKKGEVLSASQDSTTYSAAHWSKKIRYTDDSAFNGYIDEMLNGSQTSGSSSIIAAATQRAIMSALGGSTIIDGGLMLTSMIALRQNTGTAETPQYTTWAGISGIYDNTLSEQDEYVGVKGHGIAAWYGGAKVDLEDKSNYWTEEQIAAWEALTDEQKAESPLAAKSLFRMDGSGYLATANISWNDRGQITIKNITTLSDSQNTNLLNELATFNSAFHFTTGGQGGTTILSIDPQVQFSSLHIGGSTDDYLAATRKWVGDNYISKTWFNKFFKVHYKNNGTDAVLDPNNDFPAGATDKNIEAIFSFWTNYAISALGQGVDGSHAIGSLDDLSDVELTSPAADQILKFDGTHWVNAAAPQTYVLPQATSGALGGIKIGYNDATPKTYAVALNNSGQAYVAVPWTDTTYTLAGLMGSTAIGGTTQPIYWNGSAFANTTYTLGKSVPSDAVFTDHTYTNGTGLALSSGTFSINSTYQTYISHGESAYNSLSDYVKLDGDANEQTIKNSISSLSKGVINLWRSNGDYYTFLGFSNGTTETYLGGIGFKSQSDHNLYRKDSSNYYIIWDESNDGSGSGLDADLLDGQHGSYYAAASSLSNYLPLTGGTLTGNLYIAESYGISSGSYGILVYHPASWVGVSNTQWGVGTIDSVGVIRSSAAALKHYRSGDGTYDIIDSKGGQTIASNLTVGSSHNDYIKIGAIKIIYDSNNDALHIEHTTSGKVANFYAQGGIAALGSTGSGGGGGQGDVTWDLLKSSDTRQINISHLAGDANYAGVMSILTGYTTSGQNYKVQEDSSHHLYVNVPWSNTTYTNGTGLALSSNQFSINSTYQTYISHGESAYNSLSNYVKLSDTEQTITSTVDSYGKGVIEFYRASHTISFISFANKDSNGSKRTLGAIGFMADGVNNLMLRTTDANHYKIWNESNDGSGSGLDADLLDGHHASYFATASNYLPLTGGTLTGVLNIEHSSAGLLALKRTIAGGGAFIDYQPSNQTTQYFRVGAVSDTTDFAVYYYNDSTLYNPMTISSTGVLTLSAANGTAPIVTSSTTKVTNLNADLLDGQHSSYFATASSLSNYLPLTGGTVTGTTTFKTSTYGTQLIIYRDEDGGNTVIKCTNKNGIISNRCFGFEAGANVDRAFYFTDNEYTTKYWVVTTATIGNYNAGSATKLQTSRTLWGQSFDGTANVSGAMSDVSSITMNQSNNDIITPANSQFRVRIDSSVETASYAFTNSWFGCWMAGDGLIDLGRSIARWGTIYGLNYVASNSVKIGDAYLTYDSTNNALRVSANANGTGAMNLYAVGGVSALGSSGSGGGGGQGDVTWELLKQTAAEGRWIDSSYISSALNTFGQNYLPLSGGTMSGGIVLGSDVAIMTSDGYGLLASAPTSATGVTSTQWYVGSTALGGVIRTNNNPIAHYRSGVGTSYVLDSANYSSYAVPLSGGTMTGSLTITLDTAGLLVLKRANAAGGAFIDYQPANQTTKFFRVGAEYSKDYFYFIYYNDGTQTYPATISKDGVLSLSAASGTAPLSIASTTKVTNLNADLLDGVHASYFATASSLSNYLPLTGGTLTGTTTIQTATFGTQLTIKRTDSASSAIQYSNTDGVLGYIGILYNDAQVYHWTSDTSVRYKMWDEGNDGSGSGLDADLLDGQHGSYYATASSLSSYVTLATAQTISATKTFTTTQKFQCSNANAIEVKRTANSGGAFIDYYYNNQDTDYWRIGSSSDGNAYIIKNGQLEYGFIFTTAGHIKTCTNHALYLETDSTATDKDIRLYRGGADTNSIVLTAGAFRPFQAADGLISLGSTLSYFAGVYCTGIYKSGSSNDYVILGAGSHKAVSDFLLKTGGTMTGTLTLSNANYASQLVIYRDYASGNTVVKCRNSNDTIKNRAFGFDAANSAETAFYFTDNDSTNKYFVVSTSTIGNYNAGSATKLQSSRTIWGQSFDGTANVSGSLSGVDSITMNNNSSSRGDIILPSGYQFRVRINSAVETASYAFTDSWFGCWMAGDGLMSLGRDTGRWSTLYAKKGDFYSSDAGVIKIKRSKSGGGAFIDYYHANQDTHFWRAGASSDNAWSIYYDGSARYMYLSSGGNLGIGTESPSYKLHVAGTGYFSDDLTFANTKGINLLNTASVAKKAMYLSSGNVLVIGSGTSESSYNTYLRGYNVYLKFGTTGATGLALDSIGNVGIGTTSPSSKLHVDGDIYATGGVTALVATSSDIRKKNVVSYDLPLTLNQIADAPTIKFTWKDKPNLGEQVGSIAQYWQKVLPQTIRTEKDDSLSLQYGVAALVATITTARKVVDHEKRISELEKECADWKQAYSFLERAYNELKLKIA